VQFEGGLHLLFSLMIALNTAFTASVHVSLLFIYLLVSQVLLISLSAFPPKVRKISTWSGIFNTFAHIALMFLVFFGKVNVRDKVYSFGNIGTRDITWNSLQTLLSNLCILVLLSLKQHMDSLYNGSDNDPRNIKYDVIFVKPGSLSSLSAGSSDFPNALPMDNMVSAEDDSTLKIQSI